MRRIKALLLTLITLGALAWAPPTASADVDVYVTPGTHNVNGRQWRTTCEKYSATDRCRTEIWATVIVKKDGGGYAVTNGWQFNNLTYAASDYTLWIENPLATPSESWTQAGRQWRTECFTSLTGRGCRSWIKATVIETYTNDAGNSAYRQVDKWILNNMVRFTTAPIAPFTVASSLTCVNSAGGRTISIDAVDPDRKGFSLAFILEDEKTSPMQRYTGTQKVSYLDKGATCADEWSGVQFG